MPKIPLYQQQVTGTLIPQGAFHVEANPAAFGAGNARNMVMLGQGMQQLSHGLLKVEEIQEYKREREQAKAERQAERAAAKAEHQAMIMEERTSKLRSTETMNKALSEMREVNSQLRTLQGEDALDVVKRGEKAYGDILKKHSEALGGDARAREMFEYAYSGIMNSRLDSLERNREAAISLRERDAAFARNDEITKQGTDDLYGDHTARIQALADNTASAYKELEPDARKEKQKEAVSAYLEGVYSTLRDAPGGLEKAEAFRKQYQKVWDPKTSKALGAKAEKEAEALAVKDKALQLFHEKTPEERETFLREKVSDPEEEAQLRKHLDIWQTQADNLQKKKDTAMLESLWDKVEKSGYSEEAITRLPSQELRDKAYAAKKRQAARPGDWDADTFSQLDAMPAGKFYNADLTQYMGQLTAEHYKALKTRQEDLKGLNGEKAQRGARADSAWKGRFDDYFGHLNSAKAGEDGRTQYNQAYRNVLDAFEANPPKAPQDIETTLQRMAEKVTLEVNWGRDKTRERATFSPAELPLIDAPAEKSAAENRAARLEDTLGILRSNKKLPESAEVARTVPQNWPATTAYFVKQPLRKLEREVETRSAFNIPFVTDVRTRDTVAPADAWEYHLYDDSGSLLGVVEQYPEGYDSAGRFRGTIKASEPGFFDFITNPLNNYYNAPLKKGE